MTDLSAFPITKRWPAKDTSVLQLYSIATPNGIKVSAMLEECGLAYEAHKLSFAEDDQFTPEFLSISPNNKIPAILDPNGPGGKPIALFESGAILIYLAEKTGKLISDDPAEHFQTLQWVMWQMGGLGPMFGQLGHFYHFKKGELSDDYPVERFKSEAIRLLGVLDKQLDGRDYIMGADYSIADIAVWPWIRSLTGFYQAGPLVGFDNFTNVKRWFESCVDRPLSQKAIGIPA